MNTITPEKIGCVGGVGVTCIRASTAQTNPKSKRAKKLLSTSEAMRCPSCCSQEKGNCVRCHVENSDSDLVGADAVHRTDRAAVEGSAVDGVNGSSAEKRWYLGMLRGALGRWRGKRSARSLGDGVDRLQPDLSPGSLDSGNATLDSKASDMHKTSACRSRSDIVETPCPSDSNIRGKISGDTQPTERLSVSGSGRFRLPHTPTQLSPQRSALSRIENGPQQKLPNLPYRDSDSEAKTSVVTEGGGNKKRRRGKRKYFHSPSSKKNTQDLQKAQSTYVSFQEDFADDIYMNTPSQPSVASSSASPATQRSYSTTDSSLQVSPSSVTDEVFTDCSEACPEERESDDNKKQLDDARIEKLFRKVNTAFQDYASDAESVSSSNLLEDRQAPGSNSRDAKYQASAKVKPALKGERLESIMASAKLHASLDNALNMLNESTKLLPGYDRSMAFGATRHLPCGVGFFQSSRSRTYSACSRLAPIAEENVRPGVTAVGCDDKNAGDVVSNTFVESSEHGKFDLPISMSPDSPAIHGTPSLRDSCYSSAGQSLAESQVGIHPCPRSKDLDSKLKWLISAGNAIPRHSGSDNSTILVRSLHKREGFVADLLGPGRAEKCAACEWALRARRLAPVPVIPDLAWSTIVKDAGSCHERPHFHSWGTCAERLSPPVLCHSHYLQCYQYLHGDAKSDGGVGHISPAHDAFDYDACRISSIISRDVATAKTDGSYVHCSHSGEFARSSHAHRQASPSLQTDAQLCCGQVCCKHSFTEQSANSDSAFSTNGSPTPSTRDGVNTDGESIASTNDRSEVDGRSRSANDPWMRTDDLAHGNTSRGKRAQSYEDTRTGKDIAECTIARYDHRFSLVGSLCSYSHPLASDALCDSAVHLQDSASSRSTRTRLSSDSFYSSGTSFGDREPGSVEVPLEGVVVNVFSRSSSETSLESEGTLCLSEFAKSQQNVSLFSVPSFPRISDLCSPTRRSALKGAVLREEQLGSWVKNGKVKENILESFLNSSLAQMQDRSALLEESAFDSGTDKPTSDHAAKPATDTLTSSSGSSDTNTLGSGSSGSTYATSTLRSCSRFNTLGSSSCVSTDDTGETVIDQFMIRPGGRLHDIEETPSARKQHRLTKKRSSDGNKRKYRPSAFHYEHLEAPSFSNETRLLEPNGGVVGDRIITTNDERSDCPIQSHAKGEETTESFSTSLSTIPESALHSRVQTMMQSCVDIDAVIASLRESLKSSSSEETDDCVDRKLLELGEILKQKDEQIQQLHRMLLARSVQNRRFGENPQLNATM